MIQKHFLYRNIFMNNYTDNNNRLIIPSWINTIEKIKYWIENFPWIKYHKVKEITPQIKSDVDNILSIVWLPGAWKWKISESFWKKFWLNIRNKSTETQNFIELWITDYNSLLHFLYVNLDCFFKEIWIKRYNEMLENKDNFLSMFSDEDRALDFIQQVINNKNSFSYDWVYLKTDKEREQSKALSSLHVNWREDNSNVAMLLDWVNSFLITDKLRGLISDTNLNVLKIIIEPNLWLSFQRIIKRDVVWNGKKKTKDMDTVTEFRLREWIHLFENYTIPALFDSSAYMIKYTDKTDHELTLQQRYDVRKSIIKSSNKLLEENKWQYFEEYIINYVSLLMEHFYHYS